MLVKTFVIFCLCVGFTAIRADVTKIPVGKYTMVIGKPADWAEAKQACQADGKQLVNVETEKKWTEIRDMITSRGYAAISKGIFKDLFWTAGYEKMPEKGKYLWTSGAELPVKAGYWGFKQPNQLQGNQHCLAITAYKEGKNSVGLNDFFCHKKLEYICEHVGNKNNNNNNDNVVYTISAGEFSIVSGKPLNYNEAKQACKEDGKQLVNVETEKKWQEISGLITSLRYHTISKGIFKDLFWTAGYEKMPEQGKYLWTSGVELPIKANYWGFKQPNQLKKNQHCLAVTAYKEGGKPIGLNDFFCDKPLEYICENVQKKDIKIVNKTPADKKYTIVSDKKLTYSEAKQACKGDGKDLVNIETETKWKTIKDLITKQGHIGDGTPKELFWTAGYSLPSDDKFKWMNGNEFPVKASYWGPSQPNYIEGRQNCISIEVFDKGILGVNDWFCDSKLGYVCESRIE